MTTASNLSGVPETMLWTLHNRVSEARRLDGVIRDPKCLEIYDTIPYDYERSFGTAEPSHGVRSAIFDDAVRAFVDDHSNGVIVNLGEGLETQRFRVPTPPKVLWLSIDVPEAIEVRERFIESDERHIHIAKSALDMSWFDAVPEGRPVFVTAQGLFMYFHKDDIAELVMAMARRWPGMLLMFDHIPRWLSRKSTSSKGWQKTAYYRTPPMPWGINRSEVLPTLRQWTDTTTSAEIVPFEFPRGLQRLLFGAVTAVPWLAERAPGITKARLGREQS